MPFILDVAAGVLIAAVIVGTVVWGIQTITFHQRMGGDGFGGLLIAGVGFVVGVAFVICRLLRWP
jgi:hypothetical protein